VFEVKGLGLRVQGLRFGVWGLRFTVMSEEVWVKYLKLIVQW
jgi:hypothetical protein